jgi:uncharacterized membrane protein YdbT with pleckstrin-like domain
MSKYIESNLNKDEKILYSAKLHWIIFFNKFSMIGFLLTICGIVLSLEGARALLPIGVILFLIGLIYALIIKYSTELAITNSRLIVKKGFISRKTDEMKIEKIESINVDQGILDRIFNCGTILVNGTGSGIAPINNISKPLTFRNNVNEIIDEKK